jgi:proteasome lid subunit RPN8/RPN11
MPLEMTKSLCEEVIGHARAEHPNEMCGLLVAPLGYVFPMRWIPLQNASVYSSRFYEFDVQEFMAVSAELDRRNEDIVALVHSHTATEAYPSGVDVGGALPMGWRYVIVSTANPVAKIRAFRIEQGRVTEEEVREVSCDQLQRAQPD